MKIPQVFEYCHEGMENEFPFWKTDKNDFEPVERKFIGWTNARQILNNYLDSMGEDLLVKKNRETVFIGFEQPMIWDTHHLRTVFMWQTFPEEYQQQFLEIVQSCVAKYIPNKVQDFLYELNTDSTVLRINAVLKANNMRILEMGGPTIKEHLSFMLGL